MKEGEQVERHDEGQRLIEMKDFSKREEVEPLEQNGEEELEERATHTGTKQKVMQGILSLQSTLQAALSGEEKEKGYKLVEMTDILKEARSEEKEEEDVKENNEDEDPKQKLIRDILDMQTTLQDLAKKKDGVREDNIKLEAENFVLTDYIRNLMDKSKVFGPTDF